MTLKVGSTSNHALRDAGARTGSPIIEITTVPTGITISPGRGWGDGAMVKRDVGVDHGSGSGVSVTVSVRRGSNAKQVTNPATKLSQAQRELTSLLSAVTTPLSGGTWLTSVDNYAKHENYISASAAHVAQMLKEYVRQYQRDVVVFGTAPLAAWSHASRAVCKPEHARFSHIATWLSSHFALGGLGKSGDVDGAVSHVEAGVPHIVDYMASTPDVGDLLPLHAFVALLPIAAYADAPDVQEMFLKSATPEALEILSRLTSIVVKSGGVDWLVNPANDYGEAYMSCTPYARTQDAGIAAKVAGLYDKYCRGLDAGFAPIETSRGVSGKVPKLPKGEYCGSTESVFEKLRSVDEAPVSNIDMASAYSDVMDVFYQKLQAVSTTLLFPRGVSPLVAAVLCGKNSSIPYVDDLDTSDVIHVTMLEPEISEQQAASAIGPQLVASQRASVNAAKTSARKKVSALIADNAATLAGMVDPDKESVRIFSAVGDRLQAFADCIDEGSMNVFDDPVVSTLGKMAAKTVSGFDPDKIKTDDQCRAKLYASAVTLEDAARNAYDDKPIDPEEVASVDGVAEGGIDLGDLI